MHKSMTKINIESFASYARESHNNANCEYDGKNYYDTHVLMVVSTVHKFRNVFKYQEDFLATKAAANGHDLIEDAKQTYNNIKEKSNKDIADVILAVTDVPAETRLLRHLLTMPKTIKDHRAIILKMCDIHANALYSKLNGDSMYKKYVKEYRYRKPIFQIALESYAAELNQNILASMWEELDNIHNPDYKW
jgi:(p)ppGpp synthase/HD superfamily hydrolase